MDDQNSLDMQAQRDFEFTQGIRKNLIMELTKKGPLPETKDDSQILLTAMKDMDAQNIQRLRVKVEDKNGDNMAGMAVMVSNILREINGAAFRFDEPTKAVSDAYVKRLPATIDPVKTVPGELSTDPAQGDYGTFIAKMKS